MQKHTGPWRSNDNGLDLKALSKCPLIPGALQYYEQAAVSLWCHTSSSYAKSHNKKQRGNTVYYPCISGMITRLQEKKSSVANLLVVIWYVFQLCEVLADTLEGTRLMAWSKLNW